LKGFGAGFKEGEQAEKVEAQSKAALDAIKAFAPDYFVADGDPYGTGFQVHITKYANQQRATGGKVPELIWAKNVKLMTSDDPRDNGRCASTEERTKRVRQAEEWNREGIPVKVYWIEGNTVNEEVDKLYYHGAWKMLEPEHYAKRGLIKITSPGPQQPPWANGLSDNWRTCLGKIEASERGEKCGFEQCSYINAAKGHTFFNELDIAGIDKHGIGAFGGGESVLLELSSKYMNNQSRFDQNNVIVLAHSRGKDDVDPDFRAVEHVGAAFKR